MSASTGLTCAVCERRSDLYLCSACQNALRDLLTGLATGWTVENDHRTYQSAGWLELLEDCALGFTRLGESTRRSTERNTPMPVNLGASQLLENVHSMLARWVQDLCESRGVELP